MGTLVSLVPSDVLVANSVMVAPAARVSDVSKVVAPVTSRAPVMFVSVNSSISPVPLASNSKSALVIFVVIVLFLILIVVVLLDNFLSFHLMIPHSPE